MRTLITGANGFAGTYLVEHLSNTVSAELHGVGLNAPNNPARFNSYASLDMRNREEVSAYIKEVQPDEIYHLAAQASPARSHTDPWNTLEINIRSQLNVLLACLEHDLRPRIIVISSGDIYHVTPDQIPLKESTPLKSSSPYSLSKITQDMMALQYYESYGLDIIRVRPFNHVGPGQTANFVVPDFAMQIARIEHGLQEPVMRVGNLSAQRDFTDVRDVVRAYALLMQHGRAGQVYNIASGKAITIQMVLDTLLSFTEVSIDVQVDPNRLRPVDIPVISGDYSRLHDLTGWNPIIPFDQTLHDVMEHCRHNIHRIAGSN